MTEPERNDAMAGYIETVLGPIRPEELGITMMHEHCLIVQPDSYMDLAGMEGEKFAFLHEPVTMENRAKVYLYMHKHRDNLDLSDESLSIREFGYYKQAGGNSIVEVSTPGIGRDPHALKRIAKATGLNIIASTGLYIDDSVPEPYRSMNEDEIADFFLSELKNGMDDTDIKPGYIGEIGMSDDWRKHEEVVLAGAGIACAKSGVAMTVHQPIFKTWGTRIVEILKSVGTDLNRVVLSHCDPTLTDKNYHRTLLDMGVRLQFDQFSLEFPCTYGPYEKRWLPRDIDRIRHIKYLCDMGFEDRITVSQDMCFKSLYRTYGGPGIAHIIQNLREYFLFEGITEEQLEKILIKNPMDILTQGG